MSKKDRNKTSGVINANIKKDQIRVIDFLFVILLKVGIFLVTVIAYVLFNVVVLLETGIQLSLCDKHSFSQREYKSNTMTIDKFIIVPAGLDVIMKRMYWMFRTVFQGISDLSNRCTKELFITEAIYNNENSISKRILKFHVSKYINAWIALILIYFSNIKITIVVKYKFNIFYGSFPWQEVKRKHVRFCV